MIIFLVAWGICYYRGKAPNFVRYAPIVLLVLSALETLNGMMNGSEGHVIGGAIAMVVYLGCAALGAKTSKPPVEVVDDKWTKAEEAEFQRLMNARRQSGY